MCKQHPSSSASHTHQSKAHVQWQTAVSVLLGGQTEEILCPPGHTAQRMPKCMLSLEPGSYKQNNCVNFGPVNIYMQQPQNCF